MRPCFGYELSYLQPLLYDPNHRRFYGQFLKIRYFNLLF